MVPVTILEIERGRQSCAVRVLYPTRRPPLEAGPPAHSLSRHLTRSDHALFPTLSIHHLPNKARPLARTMHARPGAATSCGPVKGRLGTAWARLSVRHP